ncbi:GNAT family N-acetyltransferase [Paraprevotella xylaniphila]|uniref:GNAT family N-acetyltransferase n=1 Tax=Paraprevotella xylaniphila TaxID=454155 RepID=UPI001032C68F|nr:GNAT family N-acetyltransferase [Paraprevotella xylaniphila]
MDGKGLIRACEKSDCGWKCCSFGSDGHIVILPYEFNGHEQEISHLRIIDNDYFGGKKVKCIAKDCKSCDNGYKPIMCRTYPLWVKSVKKGFVFRSGKCPLKNEQLTKHKEFVLGIFDNYRKALLSQTDVDAFLSKAWIDRYEPLFPTHRGSIECKMEVKSLSMFDMTEIETMEQALLSNPEICFASEPQDIAKCLQSGCSYGLWLDGSFVAYSLAYFTEYGTAYVDKCFVSSDYRGNGFQYILLNANIARLVSNGVQEIFAMTSPKNDASIKSFTNAGFSPKRATKYKGVERVILKWEL